MNLDFETRSEIDLAKVGAHVYFDHPSTDIWCAAYAFGEEEPAVWHRGDPCPPTIRHYIEKTDGQIAAWNAAFERLAWKKIWAPKYGFPTASDHRFRCTMTESLGMNMPGKLEQAGPAFALGTVKDDIGHRLMLKMCRPRKIEIIDGKQIVTWWDVPDQIERLEKYCQQDVRVERQISKLVLRLRPLEQRLYNLDAVMNDRGVFVDKALCEAAEWVVYNTVRDLDLMMKVATDGQVTGVSNISGLKDWLIRQGIEAKFVESLDREGTETLLAYREDLLKPNVAQALAIRQEGSKTSTAKIKTMLRRRQEDGRIRGNLQFYGASATGRWAARGVQFQNLTRPIILGDKKNGTVAIDQQIETMAAFIKQGNHKMIQMAYGPPMTVIADCVRSMICAPPGKILWSSDFSNIEGSVVAWLAGQEDKLEAFRAYYAGTGPDVYLIQAGAIYNVPIEQTYPYRQIGKVGELSLGFQGGARAFAKMAKNYGMRIAELYEGIWGTATEEHKENALIGWDKRGRSTGMSEKGWKAAEVIKLAWRAKNWRIAAYWQELEEAAVDAVRNPGKITVARYIKFKKNGSSLFCLLPSGRGLCYPYATMVEKMMPWGKIKEVIQYKAIDQTIKKWKEKTFYGGLGVENVTQAVARDVMAEAMLRIEDAGYNPVLTVHDEIISETDINFGSMKEYNELMTEQPLWAPGLPIAAGGWQGVRYRKA